MNIFSFFLGDPQKQQAAITKRFQLAIIKLKAARVAGDKVAERAALAEMRAVAAVGSNQAAAALSVANSPARINAMAAKAAADLKSGTFKVVGFAVVGLAFVAWAYGKGRG